jgi:hypothetical protein
MAAMSDVPLLTSDDLRRLGAAYTPRAPCEACASLACPGWEAVPGGFDQRLLQRLGTLRRPDDEDPTLTEYHPAGTNTWSRDAPIAPSFFPYNRSEAWRCVRCARPFLRYTEYGGYYVEQRIRDLRPELVVDLPG